MKIYKKIVYLLVGIASICVVTLSCQKQPFKDVLVILSNNYISHRVLVQIINANTSSTKTYPTNTEITITGEAVKDGLIYESGGLMLTEAVGNAKATNGSFALAIKPYLSISKDKPVRFTINVNAPGFLPTSREVVITNKDSLQYINLSLIEKALTPTGVSIVEKEITGITNGTLSTTTVVNVPNKNLQNLVSITFPAGVTFKNSNADIINSNSNLNLSAIHFDNTTAESIIAIPGGTNNIVDNQGIKRSFALAGAVSITANIGSDEVKSFSTPLQVEVELDPKTINLKTNSTIQAGDILDVWSNTLGGSWTKEGTAVVFAAGGKLKAIINVNHLSVWALSTTNEILTAKVTYTTDASGGVIHYLRLNSANGGQFLAGEILSLKNGQQFDLELFKNIDCVLNLYEGSSSNGKLIQTINIAAGTTSINLNYETPKDRPVLNFDLETRCGNTVFRYTGPITYRLNGTNLWQPFNPAVNGTLTTTLLEWNKTYDFKVTYNNTSYLRTRIVSKEEFIQVGTSNIWNYNGKSNVAPKTFFPETLICK